jgi:chemotaxis protein MotB
MADEAPRPIIIKRIKKYGAGHHGGAWKVAYADFTTAMMAFFMLLWLLNVTTKDQKNGLADYFSPMVVSNSKSGAGGVMGGTSVSKDGAQNNGAAVALPNPPAPPPAGATNDHTDPPKSAREIEEEAWQRAASQREENMFQQSEAELRQSIQEMAELKNMNENLVIDVTKEGMRIQLIDNDHRAMFKDGTAVMYDYAKKMLAQIAVSINKMPNRISISGHTDATPLKRTDGYSNWELSADRANTARRVLLEANVSPDRISEVKGKANSDPLLPDNRARPENRRISILLIREAPVLPPNSAH